MLSRRMFVAGSAITAASLGTRAQGATGDVSIGAIWPFSGANAQIGVDARLAMETAIEIINNPHPELDLPLAAGSGLPGLGGAKINLVTADHASDPQRGRSEAERLITQDKVAAILGCYQSSVATTVTQAAERFQVPFIAADSSSPTLTQRGLKYTFRAAAHDEMFSQAMFDFLDALRGSGRKIQTLALFHEDTLFGTDSAGAQRKLAGERGYKIAVDLKYRANSPSLTAEVQQLKAADADVLLPSSYTTDSILLVKTMGELGYRPKNMLAQDAGFSDKALYDAVGKQIEGALTRSSFSLDLAAKRPMVGAVNTMFRARANKDLVDLTSRHFMAMMVIAEAIDRARSTDGSKIREALVATDIPGEKTIMPWRGIRFDENGQNLQADPVLLQWLNERFVTVYPVQAAIQQVRWN